MKKYIFSGFLTVYLFTVFNVAAQDFWEIINTPPNIDFNGFDLNSNTDLFSGVTFSIGGGVLCKLNNGNIWDTSLYFNNDVFSPVYIDDSDNIYTASKHLYYSDNNGISWSLLYSNQVFGITSIFKSSDNNIFLGTWGGIIKSEPINTNWEQVLQLENTEVVRTIIENTYTGVLYAGTTNFIGGGGVYISTDRGDSWEHIGLMDHYVSALALNSNGDLFAGTKGHSYLGTGGVFVLHNGQGEWETLNNDELVTSMVINSEDDIYIGCSSLDYFGGGIRRSIDNGQTWEDISLESMYDNGIKNLILGPQEHLYAFEHNSPTPLYKSVDPTITFLPENEIEKCIKTFNYPNPFSEETTIYFELPLTNPIEVQIAIYNSQGNKIQDIILPKYFGKGQSIKWNSKGLPAGLYYYKLSAGSIRTFKKMVLQK